MGRERARRGLITVLTIERHINAELIVGNFIGRT